WWWEVEYDNRNPSLNVTTANEIHIPVGRPVFFRLTSNDVIHSFWVPNLHGKTDLIPGRETTTWLRADRAGTFRGQCAEFCGHQHAHMALTVVAEAPEQFQAWYDAQLKPAREPATPAEARGREVFLTSPCVMCHKIQGTDAGGNAGPDLTHLASRPTLAAGTLENTRGHLAGWVVDSQKIKPGNRMPPNNIEPDDLQALLDYLQSLK
ncbi:MAG TPA: c-type cytochrome, partial [Pyrinomonadaceae bacterium]|nr:c-type cytochrome [Pyrinomonadaceae bacterium]